MIKEAIQKIVGKHDLTYEEAYCVMNEIMSGKTSPTENAAYLAALSTKSAKAETTAEIAGSAAAMREHALAVEHPGIEVLEIVGTGGDHAGSINISTTASFIMHKTSQEHRPVLHVRTEVSHFDEIRRCYPQGTRHPHRIQHPRPLDESRASRAHDPRRLR